MANASHRDCTPDLSQHLPGLAHRALHRYLPCEVVGALARACGVRGYRRVYDPLVVLWTLVDDALSGNLSLEAQVERLAAASGQELSAGSGALCRARQRQPLALMQACAEHVGRVAAGFQRDASERVDYAVDGFYTALLDSPANQERYPQSACQRAGCGWPLLHAVALVDQGTGCIMALSLGGLGDHDAKLARPLWDRVAHGDRVVMDRGFASYGMLSAAQTRGWTAVMRQHQRRLNSDPLTGDSDDRVEVWSAPVKRPEWWDAEQPAQQAVRVVRQRLPNGEVMALNTNANAAQLSGAEVLALYEQRWRIETRFLELKHYLAIEPLRARDPDTAEMLLWAWVLTFNLIRCLLCEAAAARGCSPYDLSFSAARVVLEAAQLCHSLDEETLGKRVVARVGANPLPRRGEGRRDEPRRVKPWHRAYSLLRRARREYHEWRRSRYG